MEAISQSFLLHYIWDFNVTQNTQCGCQLLFQWLFIVNLRECTWWLAGDVQRDRAAELLGLHPCNFRPRHSSKLGNEFWLFTNYDPGDLLGGWEQEKRCLFLATIDIDLTLDFLLKKLVLNPILMYSYNFIYISYWGICNVVNTIYSSR